MFSPDDETTVLTRESATAEVLVDLVDDGLHSLSPMLDGQSIHTFLSDGFICGFPSDVDVSNYNDPLPICVDDGDRNCPLDGELVPADSLTIDHVFINSCASTIPSGCVTGLPVNVGLGLLKHASSLIGGYRPKDGLPQEAALHHALLRAGYSAAERCYILNKNSHALDFEAYPYVVFGQPEHALSVSPDRSYTVDVTDGGDAKSIVAVSNVNDHVVDVVLSDVPQCDASRTALRNRLDDQKDWPLFYSTFREPTRVRVLVYSWGKIQADQLEFEMTTDALPNSDFDRISNSIANATGLKRLGMLDRKAQGQLTDIQNQIAGLPPKQPV